MLIPAFTRLRTPVLLLYYKSFIVYTPLYI